MVLGRVVKNAMAQSQDDGDEAEESGFEPMNPFPDEDTWIPMPRWNPRIESDEDRNIVISREKSSYVTAYDLLSYAEMTISNATVGMSHYEEERRDLGQQESYEKLEEAEAKVGEARKLVREVAEEQDR